MIDQVVAIAGWEFRNTLRTRWVLGCGAAFALSSVGVVILGMRSVGELGLDGIGPAATSLLGMAMLLPPLVGLLLGAGAIAGARERGTLQMVLVQPDTRRTFVPGTFLGLAAAMWGVLATGLGVAGLILISVADLSDARLLLGVVVATFAAATASVAIGMFVSACSKTRAQATAWCVVLWFFFGVGADLILVSLVPALGLGHQGMFFALLANPVEAARTIALLIIDPELSALGPFGAFVSWEVGATLGMAMLGAALVGWSVLALFGAGKVLDRAEI